MFSTTARFVRAHWTSKTLMLTIFVPAYVYTAQGDVSLRLRRLCAGFNSTFKALRHRRVDWTLDCTPYFGRRAVL